MALLILLLKFMTQVSKNRTDLLPHYSRLIATLNKYMPDIGAEVIAFVSCSEVVYGNIYASVCSWTKNSATSRGRKMW